MDQRSPVDKLVGQYPLNLYLTRKHLASRCFVVLFHTELSKVEPKNFKMAVIKDCWFQAMQDKIHEFDRLEVWELVPRPIYVMVITLKLIYKVNLMNMGDVLKNKARLVQRDIRQEEEEVFVSQLKGFEDQDTPHSLYRLQKAHYGLKQAPRAFRNGLASITVPYKQPVHQTLVFAVWKCADIRQSLPKSTLNLSNVSFSVLERTIKHGSFGNRKTTAMSLNMLKQMRIQKRDVKSQEEVHREALVSGDR
ncbi:retrovirus-related pol polyprotein from transposon TNT 1-94 [Tanacetum coccineum]|uniref:Retrovirus-related pol polyprotein from transposon TNT 1-94 n=1 Tax=Tanacetum coccineum TaxID=301880 RepID=A0ABQ4WNI4_9ASTR